MDCRVEPGNDESIPAFRDIEERHMANLHRGEIDAELGGAPRRLVLTLGALAELEAAFGSDDLVALAERFGSGRLRSRDLIRIIAAGLRGAGEAVTDDEVARMQVGGGAAGYVRIAVALITTTFGEAEAAGEEKDAPVRGPFARRAEDRDVRTAMS
jgi:hypothetical protein